MKSPARQPLSGKVIVAAALLALCAASAFAQRKLPAPGGMQHEPAREGRDEDMRRRVVPVPECKYAGDEIRVDFSTNNGSWTATGPGQANLGGPTAVTYASWTGNNGYWIQPFSSSQVNSAALSGTYTYTLAFNLPCMPEGYANLSIGGSIAADNTFQANLNGHPIASCSSGMCGSTTTAVSTQPSWFQQGLNVLTVTVVNTPTSWNPKTGLMTGLGAKMTLNVQCGKMCCTALPRR
ncbi:MAG TPA: hypothetical protein VL118_08860 [Luteimonas sp.]|jgi:hypothetical protein|nr:hypothetical protein [Luteimonas sp.]